MENPQESLQETVFYNLIEFCHLHGSSLEELVPEFETLFNFSELQDLGKEASFR